MAKDNNYLEYNFKQRSHSGIYILKTIHFKMTFILQRQVAQALQRIVTALLDDPSPDTIVALANSGIPLVSI